MYTIKHGDCLSHLPKLTSNSIDLILIDPPYVGMVKNYWDNKNEVYYQEFFSKILEESYRILRPGGRFISFCSNDTLKYLYQSKLLHRELLIIEKNVKQVASGRNTKNYKQHINHVEYVFVATKYAREYTKNLLLNENKKFMYSSKEINSMLGCASNGGGMWSIYTGNNKCNQVPTREQWSKFRKIFKNLPKYKTFEEVFHNNITKGNILKGFNFRIKNRKHPTQKPLRLITYILKTYSNKGDLILDFVMGSGTTGVACLKAGRDFIGFELDKEYYKIAKSRLIKINKSKISFYEKD